MGEAEKQPANGGDALWAQTYLQQVTRAQEAERQRIARDLHDDVSPEIILIIQQLDILLASPELKSAGLKQNLAELRRRADKALASLRATAQGLRPRIIDDLGLMAALEWLAGELERGTGIRAGVTASNMEAPLPPETQLLLFRIAQEALNNVRRHAGAANVNIRVEGGEDSVKMTITDDGRGFKAPETFEEMAGTGRLGLVGMYERARLLQGTLKIMSAPGRGTELTVIVPRQTANNDVKPDN